MFLPAPLVVCVRQRLDLQPIVGKTRASDRKYQSAAGNTRSFRLLPHYWLATLRWEASTLHPINGTQHRVLEQWSIAVATGKEIILQIRGTCFTDTKRISSLFASILFCLQSVRCMTMVSGGTRLCSSKAGASWRGGGRAAGFELACNTWRPPSPRNRDRGPSPFTHLGSD